MLFTCRALIVVLLVAPAAAANGQGTTSVNRPAGTDFSVTTGIGSSARVETHKVEPGPPRSGSQIYGLFQSPDETEIKPDTGAKPLESAAPSPPPPSVPEGPNAIARDRIESPQDR